MKNISKLIILTAGILTVTGCSDFLDQTSPSELNRDELSESTYYTGLLINNVYGGLVQDVTYSRDIPIAMRTNTDCELIDGLGSDAQNTSNERGNMNDNSNP